MKNGAPKVRPIGGFARIDANKTNNADAHLPPNLQRLPQLPAAAVVDAASVTVAAARGLEARGSLSYAKNTRAHPTLTGGHSCVVTGSETRDLGGFDRVRRWLQRCVPPRSPPGVHSSRGRGRNGRKGDDRGGRQPRWPRQVRRQTSASALIFMFASILANPPLGRTLGAPIFYYGGLILK